MTNEKILEVVAGYRELFATQGIPKIEHPKNKLPGIKERCLINMWEEPLSHCHWMLDQIEIFIRENRKEKAFRWLGFIQGTLWMTGFCTIEDLKERNY